MNKPIAKIEYTLRKAIYSAIRKAVSGGLKLERAEEVVSQEIGRLAFLLALRANR